MILKQRLDELNYKTKAPSISNFAIFIIIFICPQAIFLTHNHLLQVIVILFSQNHLIIRKRMEEKLLNTPKIGKAQRMTKPPYPSSMFY